MKIITEEMENTMQDFRKLTERDSASRQQFESIPFDKGGLFVDETDKATKSRLLGFARGAEKRGEFTVQTKTKTLDGIRGTLIKKIKIENKPVRAARKNKDAVVETVESVNVPVAAVTEVEKPAKAAK